MAATRIIRDRASGRNNRVDPAAGLDISNVEDKISLAHDVGELRKTSFLDRKKEEAALRRVWEDKDADEPPKGGLNVKEFGEALREMEMGIPTPLIKALFEQIVKDKEKVNHRQFLSFINSNNLIYFDEEYRMDFYERKFNLILTRNPKEGEIIVTGFTKEELRNHLLPSSELVKIGDKFVSEILKGTEKDDMKPVIDELNSVPLPVQLTFRKQVLQENIALLDEDKDWQILSEDMAIKQLDQRREKLTQPTTRRHCKHCPEIDTNNQKENLNIYEIIHLLCEDEQYSWGSFLIISIVMALIFVSTFAYVLETEPNLRGDKSFVVIEWVVSIVFSLEYFARIISCRNMWLYFWDPMNMIDFLAVIPFWIQITFAGNGSGGTLRVIRVIRLARIVRLLKSPFFTDYLDVFIKTGKESAHAFGLILTLLCLYIIVFGSLVYEMEGDGENEDGVWVAGDTPTLFISIPAAMYWCVVTMTTVGYGDYYPTQVPAQIVGVATMLTGLLVIALPVIIIGGHFDGVYSDFRKRHERKERSKDLELDSKINSVPYQRVEDYFKQLNEHINRACQAEELEFFNETDRSAFIEQGFDTKEKVIALLKSGETGLHFFPQEVPAYKRYVLYKVFGRKYRGAKPSDPFIRIRNELYRKTAKISEPS